MKNLRYEDIRHFQYLTRLEFPNTNEEIYRLLYPNTAKYLCITPDNIQLLHHTAEISTGEQIQALYRKIQAHVRLAGNALNSEKLAEFLRIDEARYLLSELMINNPQLEKRLYQRLRNKVDYNIKSRVYKPLLLGPLLERNEFVSNYLQTNIGQPDESENYFNKLREMIQQINEQTEYVNVPSYFDLIRSLLIYANKQISSTTLVIQTYRNYCILSAGMDTIDSKYYHFFGKDKRPPNNTATLQLDYYDITNLMQIYNQIRTQPEI